MSVCHVRFDSASLSVGMGEPSERTFLEDHAGRLKLRVELVPP